MTIFLLNVYYTPHTPHIHSTEIRIQLYLWAKRTIAMSPPKNPKPRVKELYDRYLNDIQAKLTKDGKIDPNHPGNNSLKQWGKARVGDNLVKLLFKELIGAYPRGMEQQP